MGFDRSLHDTSPTVPSRRPWLAAALSALLPGSGQWYAGRRRAGVVLMSVAAVVGVTSVWLLVVDPVRAVKLAFDTEVLVGLFVANIAVFGLRVWAAVDAYRSVGGSAGSRWVGGVVIAVVGAVLVVPHAWFGYYDVIQYDLITDVFAPPETTTATTSSTTTSGATSTVTASGASTTTTTTT
ncbi:MAG: hypothetical protein KJP12_04560, partial [Acidimicrobiia bacterium]|nr:hypothetical protein [Acidimicrobiia bacterium]